MRGLLGYLSLLLWINADAEIQLVDQSQFAAKTRDLSHLDLFLKSSTLRPLVLSTIPVPPVRYKWIMAEEVSAVLTTQRPVGIPWRFKTEELLSDKEWRMLMAIMDAVLPSVERESMATRRRSISKAYISEARYQEAVARLKRDSVVLDSASEEDLNKYLSERPTDDLLFQQVLKGMLHHLPLETRSLLFRVLSILRCVIQGISKGIERDTYERF